MPGLNIAPAGQQGARVRRKHSKTLTGCVNCKRRHMKCDESKPSCQRCRKSGLTCEGYHYPKAKIFELSKPASSTASPPTVPESPPAHTRPQVALHDDPPPMIIRDANISWRRALLEAFFAACIPDIHEWNSGSVSNLTGPLPYAPWPSVTWQLAQSDGQGLVAQALSCLTLVALGMKTKTCKMISKARSQYDKVLCQLQIEMATLQAIYDPIAMEQHLNLLASVGFCCAQFEYMLGSWENGNRHIQGMVSLWQDGSSQLQHEDSQAMFYDAWLLCMACCVTDHRAPAYSPTERAVPWTSTHDGEQVPIRALLATSEQIACLLQDHDHRARYLEADAMPDLLEMLEAALDDVDGFVKSQEHAVLGEWLEAHSELRPTANLSSLEALPSAVLSGYASSFVLQSIGTAWKLIRMQSTNSFQASHVAEIRMQQICESHLTRVCQLVQDLYDQRYKMVTVSTLLHLVDSARVGFATLWDFCGGSTTVAVPWYISIGNHVASTGYGSLREPWQALQCVEDDTCVAPQVANILLGGPIPE